jgi:hypothetical protein
MPRKRLFPPLDPQTQRPLENKGRDEHTILTGNGRVRLWRRHWSSPATGSLTPVDVLLDATEASVTVAVRELACRLNQAARNFDTTAENLARAAQIRLSGELLRQVVEAEGRAVLKAQQSGTLLIGWTAADCHVPPPEKPAKAAAVAPAVGSSAGPALAPAAVTTRIYLGSDGVQVPLVTDAEKQARRQKVKQKRRRCGKKRQPLPRAQPGADQRYQEFKIVTFYDEEQKHRHVGVTQGDHQAAGELMRREASRLRLDLAADKVAVVDGAPWIRNQIQGQSLPLDVIELDFYHLADNVHKARRVVYGEEAEQGQAWAAQVLHTAKHAGYAALRDELVAWRKGLRGAKKRQAASPLLGYVTDRREMVAYPEYLAAGRQIGSGPTESMCKTTTTRLKGAGMRWDAGNAEALMALDALEQSGEWKRYWKLCLNPAA